MSIPNKQIGWSNESNLLWYILKQLNKLTSVISKVSGGGYTPPYKVYSARISMSDGAATVFENTLGATPIWNVLSGGGILSTTVVPLIGQTNVFVQASSAASSSSPKIVSSYWTPSPWQVVIQQTDNTGVLDSTQQVFIEIRVYN
jgi:hypothetical protein